MENIFSNIKKVDIKRILAQMIWKWIKKEWNVFQIIVTSSLMFFKSDFNAIFLSN
jgi:hypothetical protein